MAGHQAWSGGTRYIFASPGRASCRYRPLSSNVDPVRMKSELERAKTAALVQTVLLCLIVEGLVLLVLRQFSVNMLEAVALSVICLDPLSLWFARPLCRYLLRENQ